MNFIILSIILLSIGIYGLLTKRNLIKIFISLELIAIAATMNFVLFAVSHGIGEALLILAFSTETAASAVILAVLVILSKKYGITDIDKIPKLIRKKEVNIDKEKEEVVEE
ncbi:MAG: NADH-quinone oxidoreductase subunit K [Candidatus Bathyarchaeota archaeon]|nr:NADH-quinone oxidoreductase subunit K [Candidatus Termiticorpusculum sp.]